MPFPSILDLAALSPAQGFVIQGDSTADSFDDWAGYSISSAGDINGDGIDDIIVGSPRSDGIRGRAYVVFGTTGEFGDEVGGRRVLDLTTLTAAEGFLLQNLSGGGYSGWSVSAAGDVNGDGIDDVIVGAPLLYSGAQFSGESYVVFGTTGEFGTDVGGRQVIELRDLNAAQGFIIQGDNPNSRSGYSVSGAGDVNGDGFADLIVSDHFEPGDPQRAYVVFGSDDLGGQVIDFATLTPAEGFMIRRAGTGGTSEAGRRVSEAGDVNGDGIDDLIVGAPGISEAYVLFGTTGEFGSNVGGLQTVDIATLSAAQGFVIKGGSGSFTGFNLSSAGDVNGDGLDDLIIGAPLAGSAAYVVFGTTAGFGTPVGGRQVLDLATLGPAQGFVIDGPGRTGWGVSGAGDVDGDGFDDLMVGNYRYSSNRGIAYLLFGTDGAFGTTVGGRQVVDLAALTDEQGFRMVGDTGDFAGWAVSSAGDVNADGIADMLVSAFRGGPNGRSYLVYGQLDSDDVLIGTAGADALYGGRGSDQLFGEAGDDSLEGGAGDDYVAGGDGDDVLTGGSGADFLIGGADNDKLFGEGGDDDLHGEDGDDYLAGGAGNDILHGGNGVDFLTGGAGNDKLFGNDGDDGLYGDDGDDYLAGGAGRDGLQGGAGVDFLTGGADGDWLFGGDGDDGLYGEDGDDWLLGEGGRDGLQGGLGNDFLFGGADTDWLFGGEGDDSLFGGEGDDSLFGEDGDDWLLGEGADDRLDGGGGNDNLLGGAGADFLAGGVDDDKLFGEEGDDDLEGGTGEDYLAGGAGADTLTGGTGVDFLTGGGDNDKLFGEDGDDGLYGDDGDDYLAGGAGRDGLQGGAGVDFLTGGADGDWLFGGDGDDGLYGDDGDDWLLGEGGRDGLQGGLGNDFLLGGADTDWLFGGDGADTLYGNEGDDYLEGGAGPDRFVFDSALGAGNIDTITDFQAGSDAILLDDAVFAGLAPGALDPGAFVIGGAAQDANDRIVYDQATGRLYYDADGNGAGAQVQFATLSGAPILAASDFTVI